MIWNIIDWKSIALRINRLQLKIYKASLEKNIASVRKYQPKKYGGQSIMGNFQLLHNFCHDKKTAMDFKLKML